MAKRSSQSVQKRQRERRKAEKAAAKRERKALKKAMAVAIGEGRLPEGTELPEDVEQLEALIEEARTEGTDPGAAAGSADEAEIATEPGSVGEVRTGEEDRDDSPDPEAGKTE